MLLERIVGEQIDEKTSLSERSLSRELGIGRTPVREAMRDLVRDGVLEVMPARGTFIRQLSWKEAHDIFEVRCSNRKR